MIQKSMVFHPDQKLYRKTRVEFVSFNISAGILSDLCPLYAPL